MLSEQGITYFAQHAIALHDEPVRQSAEDLTSLLSWVETAT
jgi:hypothetical protein